MKVIKKKIAKIKRIQLINNKITKLYKLMVNHIKKLKKYAI